MQEPEPVQMLLSVGRIGPSPPKDLFEHEFRREPPHYGPGTYEGSFGPLLQAMARGCPVPSPKQEKQSRDRYDLQWFKRAVQDDPAKSVPEMAVDKHRD